GERRQAGRAGGKVSMTGGGDLTVGPEPITADAFDGGDIKATSMLLRGILAADPGGKRRRQMCSARFATASAASFTASGSVGCACTVRATSSALAANSTARAASAIRSE